MSGRPYHQLISSTVPADAFECVGEDLALPRVRQLVQHGHRAHVVVVADHVRVEDDLHGRLVRRRAKRKHSNSKEGGYLTPTVSGPFSRFRHFAFSLSNGFTV